MGKPHLNFFYKEDGELVCQCVAKERAVYLSTYIAKKCKGHQCESGSSSETGQYHPFLDIDPKSGCVCKSHPCENVSGQKHSCEDPKFPVLHYREDEDTTAGTV